MRATVAIARSLLDEPHHDGSDIYVLERPTELGGEAVVRVDVPGDVEAVALRWVEDGEGRGVAAKRDGARSWTARFRVRNPQVRYRWLLSGGQLGHAWLNGLGLVRHDVPDADDFMLSLDPGGPAWHLGSVVYEIFPDRFATTGAGDDPPIWAIRRGWNELPTGRGPETPYEWFGGDLGGVEARLDHIEALGANVIYADLPSRQHPSLRLHDIRPGRSVAWWRRGARVALPRRACAWHARDLRPDDEPHGRQA